MSGQIRKEGDPWRQALGAVPPLAAPPEMISRVMGCVRSREKRRWWQRSFWEWNKGLRALFVLVHVGLLAGFVTGGIRAASILSEQSWADPAEWWAAASGWASSAAAFFSALSSHIAPGWTVAVLLILFALHLSLMAAASAVYRMLLQRA